ncbi:hypothetical protein V6N13_036834 [Hibiscus sabdariffa]|uniref:Uncharacterized protein n=1 Tax=Hibiscus sabdariffa TaxID=183260 RepID=A0ABR2S574_9ROSI
MDEFLAHFPQPERIHQPSALVGPLASSLVASSACPLAHSSPPDMLFACFAGLKFSRVLDLDVLNAHGGNDFEM